MVNYSLAQNGTITEPNPFDLRYRLDKVDQLAITAPKGNPFNISPPAESLKKKLKEKEKYKEDVIFQLSRYEDDRSVPRNWLLFLILPLLLMLTLIASLFREKLNLLYKSFINSNMLNLAYRESVGRTNIHNFLLYILSIISFGVFGLVLFMERNINTENFLEAIVIALSLSAVYILTKLLCIYFVKAVFSDKKNMGSYLFMFGQYNFILGILLIPFITFLAFAPSSATNIISYIAFFFIAIWWIMRILKGLQIGSKFISINIFRFFAYLCTVEITPVIILLTTISLILSF